MRKEDVLKIIDEVMNNREIDSIRNAILAIRDKVIEIPSIYDDDKLVEYAHWEKNMRGDYSLVCSNCGYGLPLKSYTGDAVLAFYDCNRVSDERETARAIEDLANYCPCCGAYMREKPPF